MSWLLDRDKHIWKPYREALGFAFEEFQKVFDRKPILLDAGCGHSDIILDFYKKSEKVIGVDLDAKALERNPFIQEKITADLANMPLPDKSVDIITSSWVIEHVSDVRNFVGESARVLRSGGYFVFITVNKYSLPALLSQLVPNKFHGAIVEAAYDRVEYDTYPTVYQMNSVRKIQKLLYQADFKCIQLLLTDDVKFLGFNEQIRPFANIWHKLVMTRLGKPIRANIIGVFKRV